MLETGEEISKMMNLVKQGIVLNDAKEIFIGDLTPERSFRDAHCNVWTRSEVTEMMIVPHACRPASHKNRVGCKHGA